MPAIRESSAKKKSRKKGSKKPKVRTPVPNNWRESDLPTDEKITSSQARRWYRIKYLDAPDIRWELRVSRQSTTAGSEVLGVTYLASHREVEMKAWKRHGGPDGWARYLSREKEQWKGPEPFPEPGIPATSDDKVDIRFQIGSISPALQRLFEEFLLRFEHPWVWQECNAVLDAAGIVDNTARVNHLRTALETLPQYPQRRTSRSRMKIFMRCGNEVLQRAPTKDGNAGLEAIILASGDTLCVWSVEYLTELYEMLNEIIDKYGIMGWKRLRWNVYYTHRQFLGGIYFDIRDHTWADPAFHWLAGRAEPGSVIHSERSKCQAGIDYNERLPVNEF